MGLGAAAAILPGLAGKSAFAASGTLALAYGAMGANRHPYGISNATDSDIAELIFDPLFTMDAKAQVHPVLVESFRLVDPTRWRLTLRKGVKFHNGQPMTAEDAKFSIENMIKPESTGTSWLFSSRIDRAEVVDERTFDIITKQWDRDLLSTFGYISYVIPRSASDPKAFAQQPIGTGPYIFEEHIPNNRVVLRANPSYWGSRKPRFQKITVRQIAENSTRMSALIAREVDFASNISPDDAKSIQSAGINLAQGLSYRVVYIRFNLLADGPWKDKRVRHALNLAVDRDAIRKAVLGGYGADMRAPVAATVPTMHPRLSPYSYDPAAAKRLLAEAGYGNGFEVTLATPNGRYLKDREIAEAVAGQLEKIGVRVSVAPLEWGAYLQQTRTEKTTTGRKYGLSLMGWGNIASDPGWGLVPFEEKSSWNLGGYANPELEKILAKAKQETVGPEIRKLYQSAQEMVWDDAPWLFLYELPILVGHNQKIKGLKLRPDDIIKWHELGA